MLEILMLHDISNYKYLQSIQGTLHSFEAEDCGNVYYLKKLTVPKTLRVKVGAKVMLLRNVDEMVLLVQL